MLVLDSTRNISKLLLKALLQVRDSSSIEASLGVHLLYLGLEGPNGINQLGYGATLGHFQPVHLDSWVGGLLFGSNCLLLPKKEGHTLSKESHLMCKSLGGIRVSLGLLLQGLSGLCLLLG